MRKSKRKQRIEIFVRQWMNNLGMNKRDNLKRGIPLSVACRTCAIFFFFFFFFFFRQVEASASRVSRFPHTPLTGPISPEKRKNTAPVQEANRNGLTKRQRFYAPKIGS